MQRLSPLDAMFLNRDTPNTPRQVASLAILSPGDHPMDHDRLMQVISERIDIVPRYRQIPRRVPGSLSTPIWVDDVSFDLGVHVRQSALPKPGTRESLYELVGRLVARRLDLDRPLWELYLIEGLEDGQVALLFKAHQALVDGSETIDLAQVLLDETDNVREIPHQEWQPHPWPRPLTLMRAGVDRNVRYPHEALEITEHNLRRLTGKFPVLGNNQPPPRGVLTAPGSRHRRFAALSTDLDAYRRIRDEHCGTVNDVILAVIAGGIRGWMLTRAEQVHAKTSLRAMVPMSVDAEDGLPTSLGSKVRGYLLSLPVGESNPVVRLHQVSYALKDHRETGSAVAANELSALPGFATSTFHAVGARVAAAESGRGHHLVITNVPGPQEPVFMAGEQVTEVYPCLPLSNHRALSVGVTSYQGKVFFGIVADRDALDDLDVLAQCISEALEELLETTGRHNGRAPRGRSRPAKS